MKNYDSEVAKKNPITVLLQQGLACLASVGHVIRDRREGVHDLHCETGYVAMLRLGLDVLNVCVSESVTSSRRHSTMYTLLQLSICSSAVAMLSAITKTACMFLYAE